MTTQTHANENTGGGMEFRQRVVAVLGRFFVQNARVISADDAEAVAERLWILIGRRGLPPPLATGDQGDPGETTDEECGPLVAEVLGGSNEPLLRDAARQLVKACFYPEFTVCRDSFREVVDGACRRQELARVRKRISGAHCVDCPYWVGLNSTQHEKFLAGNWHGDEADFRAQRDVFLPEDFRALRRLVRRMVAQ
jgi:hypothetical protein